MFTIMKRLGLSSGLIAAMLAVCSCTPNNAWPGFRGGKYKPKSVADIGPGPWDVPVVGLPLTAVYMTGFGMVWTLKDVMKGFDTQERKREAKPRKDGPFIEYWSNGKKRAEGTYKNKKLDGVYTEYFESGKKKSALTYVGGERNGPYTWWFESGQKSVEGTFKAGTEHGTTKCYHENGKMSYLRGHGPNRNETNWHKNGRKQSEVTYKNGQIDGLTTRWHSNGQKAVEVNYKNGKRVSAKYWNSKGKEVETEEEARG